MKIIKTEPKKWTEHEEEKLYKEYQNGKTINDMCKIHNRSYASVNAKLKRLKKRKGEYNQAHSEEKHEINLKFVGYLNPKTILDLYSAKGTPAYEGLNVYRNDINNIFEVEENNDALKCLSRLYSENKTYDLIDLDPYGGGYDCFDLAIKMAKKGLCITFGELGAKRWKRLDYVQYRYGFNSLDEFTLKNMCNHVQKIGLRNKKELEVWDYRKWRDIGRVWFVIKPFKQLSQWGFENESIKIN